MNKLHVYPNNNLSQKLGVGLRYDSGTLIDIIINLPQGIQLLTLTKDVGGIPFHADENYIIVFKGTKYTNGAFARIMAFQGNQFDTFKLGMVTWDASSVFWNDVALKSDLSNFQFISANNFDDAWNKAAKNTMCFADITGNTGAPTQAANRWFAQIFKNDAEKYGWITTWSFTGGVYKKERNNSSSWTDWHS